MQDHRIMKKTSQMRMLFVKKRKNAFRTVNSMSKSELWLFFFAMNGRPINCDEQICETFESSDTHWGASLAVTSRFKKKKPSN